jgi:hypothetical protein
MEQTVELSFVDHHHWRRDRPKARDRLCPRRTDQRFSSAPVIRRQGGSRTASVLRPRSVLVLSLRECAQWSIIAAVALLSPALALLGFMAVEIVIGVLVDAGGPSLPVFIAAGAIGWLLLRRLGRRQGGAPVET